MRTIVDLETLNNIENAMIIIVPKGYDGMYNYLDYLYEKCPLEMVKVSSEFPELVESVYGDQVDSPVIIWKINYYIVCMSDYVSLKSTKIITRDYYNRFLKKYHQ